MKPILIIYYFNKNIELTPLKIGDLQNFTKLKLSKYYEGHKNLSVGKNNQNQLVFSNQTECDFEGQAYLDFTLDRSTNYVLQIMLEQQKGQSKNFFFGLMRDSEKDSSHGKYEHQCYSEQEKQPDSGINTMLKGTSFQSDDWSYGRRILEMRINIQKRMLRVGSLPYYYSVKQADNPQYIEPDTPYRFFLYGLNKGTKMTIVKLETVNQFDDAM